MPQYFNLMKISIYKMFALNKKLMKTFFKGWVLNSTLNHVQIIPNMMYIIWSASQ